MTHTAGDYYDQYWTSAGFQPPPNDNAFLTEQIRQLVRRGVRVADLGCGDARTIGDRAVEADAAYIGLDVSRSAVASATARGLDVREIDDIARSGLSDASIDVVFIVEVLEHLLDPLAAVAEARRILRPGGSLVATVPNAAVWPRRLELLFRGRPNAMGDAKSREEPWRDPHLRAFTTTSLAALLRLAGFHGINVGGTEPTLPGAVLGIPLAAHWPSMFARRCTAVALA